MRTGPYIWILWLLAAGVVLSGCDDNKKGTGVNENLPDTAIMKYAIAHFGEAGMFEGVELGEPYGVLVDQDKDGNKDVLVFAKGGFPGGNGAVSAFGLYRNIGSAVELLAKQLYSVQLIDTLIREGDRIYAHGHERAVTDPQCCPSIDITYAVLLSNDAIRLQPATLNRIKNSDPENGVTGSASTNLDFFGHNELEIGGSVCKYSVSSEWLEADNCIFMCGCADPTRNIFSAVIKINGRPILLTPLVDSPVNFDSWPRYWQGGDYTVIFSKPFLDGRNTLAIIRGANMVTFDVNGVHPEDWDADNLAKIDTAWNIFWEEFANAIIERNTYKISELASVNFSNNASEGYTIDDWLNIFDNYEYDALMERVRNGVTVSGSKMAATSKYLGNDAGAPIFNFEYGKWRFSGILGD